MWLKRFSVDNRFCFSITSKTFIVQMTGGSITIKDRNTQHILRKYTGHHYLYTGDINPNETECFALENGKHFYVYSLQTLNLIKRVTLPKYYESIDTYGHYSENGKILVIPAQRWCDAKGSVEGHYEYILCKYETGQYTLVDKTVVDNLDRYYWDDEDLWEPIPSMIKRQEIIDPDLQRIMKIISGDDFENK